MDALAMGDHAISIWASFGLAVVVVIINEVSARMRQKRVFRDIEVRIKAVEVRQ